MYIFHGLVVLAFIIQSDAVGNNAEWAPEDEAKLPYEVIGKILHKAGLKATKGAGRSRALIAASRDGMSRIFEDRILEINFLTTLNITAHTHERFQDDQTHFYFGNYANVVSLFGTYGRHARRISIHYHSMDADIRRDINENIINKYANHLTELRLHIDSDFDSIWDEISMENRQFQFPNVTKFIYICSDSYSSGGKSLDLNAIFPKLESVKIIGGIRDNNCLSNVTKLRELTVYFSTIPEIQFQEIFAKNKQILKLTISPEKRKTLQLIEEYLRNLQTLQIENAGEDFLFGGNRVCNLPSVTSFIFKIYGVNIIRGAPSFKMPNLKSLKLHFDNINQKLSDFINHFENLDKLEITAFGGVFDAVACIEKLTNVREYVSPFACHLLPSLDRFFMTFDKTKSKLNSLKLICIGNMKNDNYYEEIMNKINSHLKGSKKPTWTLSRAAVNGANINSLLIKLNS